MTQIFGDFVEVEEGAGEYLKIVFRPTSAPLQQRWRNNGLSADFLAGYLSTFFPVDDRTSTERHAEIKDATSYIANEMLENAMKFGYASSRHHSMCIEMFLEADAISLSTFNYMDPAKVDPFQQFIQRLLTEDPYALYTEQLERSVEDDSGAGLGFLTMLNDYGTTLGWKFSDDLPDGDDVAVTTMVRLAM